MITSFYNVIMDQYKFIEDFVHIKYLIRNKYFQRPVYFYWDDTKIKTTIMIFLG